MKRRWRAGVALVCLLAATSACDRDATGSTAAPPSATASPGTPPGIASSVIPSPPSAGASAPPSPGASVPPAVAGAPKQPRGVGLAGPPSCAALKAAIGRDLTGARIVSDASGLVSTCVAVGEVGGARVDAQILYARNTAGTPVDAVTGTGCAAATHRVELPYPTAVACDNATGTVHSGAGLARDGSFAVVLITVTDDSAGTATLRAAVTDAARKLAANVLDEIH